MGDLLAKEELSAVVSDCTTDVSVSTQFVTGDTKILSGFSVSGEKMFCFRFQLQYSKWLCGILHCINYFSVVFVFDQSSWTNSQYQPFATLWEKVLDDSHMYLSF